MTSGYDILVAMEGYTPSGPEFKRYVPLGSMVKIGGTPSVVVSHHDYVISDRSFALVFKGGDKNYIDCWDPEDGVPWAKHWIA